MKDFIKLTAIFLIISTLMCCLGCHRKDIDDVTETGDNITESRSDVLTISNKGESDYVIVWRGRALDAEKSAAKDLCEWIEVSTGAHLELKTDTIIATAEEFSQTKKIVVGRLDRYIDKSWSELGENDYCIEVKDGDVYLYGGSSKAVYAAVLKFKEEFLHCEQDSLSIPLDFMYKQIVNGREDYLNDSFLMIPDWIDQFQPSKEMLDFNEKKASFADLDGRLMSIVHRGDVQHYPENSLEGIISSIQMGADIIEIDVRLTKDNVAVLMHDYTLSRTTNYSFVKGSTVNGITLPTTDDISEWTYEQLCCLKLYEGNGGGKITEYTIPTLDEVLSVAKERCFIICDKIASYNDFKKIVLPIIIKTGAYDTVIMAKSVTISGAVLIQKTIAALPENTSKLVPFFIDTLSGDAVNKWESKVSEHVSNGLTPFFHVTGLVGSTGSSFPERLASNESNLKKLKGRARLAISCYGANGEYETEEIWDKCVDSGANVAWVEKPIEIQKYILKKYFN